MEWRGGCLAGIIRRLAETPDGHLIRLVGSGANNQMIGRQRQLFRELEKTLLRGRSLRGRIWLEQVHFEHRGTKRLDNNKHPRSRGFVFMLIGAVYAVQQGLRSLQVYENGIGALNLHCRPSELGLDHSRAVHPLSLLAMGNLVSLILDESFSFRNPYLFYTKAQMCHGIVGSEAASLLSATVSCDSRRRQRGFTAQCGFCSSCLLRRLAFAVAGYADATPYVVLDALRAPELADFVHWDALRYQCQQLKALLSRNDPWLAMALEYDWLQETAEQVGSLYGLSKDEMKAGLLSLYARHVDEFELAGGSILPPGYGASLAIA